MDVAFAFLDLLGFSEYTNTDLTGAARALESQRQILATKLLDAQVYPASDDISPLARHHLVSSFDYFLPFSDSICIASGNPDLFVRQLANFLIEAFLFTGHTYSHPRDPSCPENVEVVVFGQETTRERENWYPVLWRGGMSFGQVAAVSSPGILEGKSTSLPLLLGRPVVSAVGLEKSGKGPRLFCEPDFKERLKERDLSRYFVPVAGRSCDELLWPAFLFHDGQRAMVELGKVHELLRPAVNLWRAKRGTPVEAHYFEFIRLIARGAFRWAEIQGVAAEGRQYLHDRLASLIGDALIESVLT